MAHKWYLDVYPWGMDILGDEVSLQKNGKLLLVELAKYGDRGRDLLHAKNEGRSDASRTTLVGGQHL